MTTTGACRDGKRLLCLMKEDASLLVTVKRSRE